ncbi:MAG: hypothetical protein R3224_07485 [Balneolaceae bacterium]|nr:hypothetical protein [Balneolaceae bacterium]
MNLRPLFTSLFLLLLLPLIAAAQDETTDKPETLYLFLDCRGCDESFIQEEIPFVNFVRDRKDADLHLLITRRFTGSGGREFTLRFVGQKRFEHQNDTLTYTSYQSDTEDLRRRGLVKRIKSGLLPYLADTGVINNLDISYTGREEDRRQTDTTDKWNRWVFEIGVNAFLSGEETQSFIDIEGEIEARRITKNWKTEFEIDKGYNRQKFEDDDITDTFITQSTRFEGLIAKSLSPHWSVGLFSEALNSTRNNYKLRAGGAPAIEYNIFPYAEYAEREISFRYALLTTYNNYDEITIFNKTDELLLQQRLSAQMEFTQPWGEIESDVRAFAYTSDWSKNRFIFDLQFDFQITRGLSVRLFGRYSVINDQLNIPLSDLSEEERLLDLRERATSFDFRMFVGLEYTFGSIFSSIVNPRF